VDVDVDVAGDLDSQLLGWTSLPAGGQTPSDVGVTIAGLPIGIGFGFGLLWSP